METREPELTVIVPAYNEAPTISIFLRHLEQVLKKEVSSHEIVVVDDGSLDGTWSTLCSLRGEIVGLKAVRLSRNFGKDAALCAGLAEASGELTLILDGDFEHPLEVIPTMLETFRSSGVNVVDAVKTRAETENRIYRFLAKAFYRIFRLLSGYELGSQSDFKLFDRKVRQAWLEIGERNVFFRGLIAWMGFEHASVTFTVPDLPERSTRWTRLSLIRMAVRSITSFSSIPLQLVTLLGLATFSLACLLGTQTFYRWWNGEAVEGFTTVILLQLIQGSITMGALGIMGLYLARISEEVKARPRYLVAERSTPSS